jgi:hypothetical protein
MGIVWSHSPYSPDLTPSDYHMFGHLEKACSNFANYETVQNALRQWL